MKAFQLSKILLLANRMLLGAVFGFFGFSFFFNYASQPELPTQAKELIESFVRSGYLFHMVKGTEAVCGLLLISGLFVPLATVLIAPIVINIFAFHLFLAPDWGSLLFSTLLVVATATLAWQHIDAFAALLQPKSASLKPENRAQTKELDDHLDKAG